MDQIRNRIKAFLLPYYVRFRKRYKKRDPDRPSRLVIESFDGYEIAYRKGTADEEVIRQEFGENIFFSAVTDYQPEAGHVIIDVGAHIGAFSLLASTKVGPSGTVYAIEASRETSDFLKINAALNRCENLFVHYMALGAKEGKTRLYHHGTNWGHSTVKQLSPHYETVHTHSLTSFLDQNGIDHCHFMKMNCEGAEFPILLNTPGEVLRRFDRMLILYHGDLWQRNTGEDLITNLESNGFECSQPKQGARRGWIAAVNK